MVRKAIFFAIDNNYSFSVAIVIMGLKKHSKELMDQLDIVIYHDGITEKNKNLLNKLHANIIFKSIEFPENYNNMLLHKHIQKWGIYILCKFFGFELIKEYDKVLFLDADMLVVGDISEVFDYQEDMAWRKVVAYNPVERWSTLLRSKDDYISSGNGGFMLFDKGVRKYFISNNEIVEAFESIKDLSGGGIDERIMGYLAYKNNMSVKEIDFKYNCVAGNIAKSEDARILHFTGHRGVVTKPWKNLAAFLYFKEWAYYYQEWIDMGGEGLVTFTENDYYNLLGFQQTDTIKKLNKQLKEAEKQLKEAEKQLKEAEKLSFVIKMKAKKIMTKLGLI